jgi:hypothetical protein
VLKRSSILAIHPAANPKYIDINKLIYTYDAVGNVTTSPKATIDGKICENNYTVNMVFPQNLFNPETYNLNLIIFVQFGTIYSSNQGG